MVRYPNHWATAARPLEKTATRRLLATDLVILNPGQVMWTTPELAPPLLTTTPTGGCLSSRQKHRSATRWVFGGTRLDALTTRLRRPRVLHEYNSSFKTCKLEILLWLKLSSERKKLLKKVAGNCGSLVVKVSNHGRHVMSSSPVPLKTRRVGQRCTLNLSRPETFSRWCGVVVRRGGTSSGVVHVT
ncbi:uncharacterized protein TNCV_976981 [Trichonephila clavipes]|nr:uncharacterized protein TNCV_976981 [Trichonephila clavipes]